MTVVNCGCVRRGLGAEKLCEEHRKGPGFRPGDRIEAVQMDNDPDPVPPGTRGRVIESRFHQFYRHEFWQVEVEWENGRTLSLVMPPDEAKKVEDA